MPPIICLWLVSVKLAKIPELETAEKKTAAFPAPENAGRTAIYSNTTENIRWSDTGTDGAIKRDRQRAKPLRNT